MTTTTSLEPMLVETTRFGPIEVDEERIISVDEGIPGFRDLQRFTLVDVEGDQPFFWVQDVDDGELAFLAVVPWDYFPDYTFTLSDDDEFALGVESVDEVLVLSIVTVDRENESVSANLLGPLVVNHRTRRARQVVVHGDHSTRAPLGPVG